MTLLKERHARRTRVARLTVEMLVTNFEFAPASVIIELVETLPGIERISVDEASGRTVITYRSDDVSLPRIVDVLGGAGFYTLIGSVGSADRYVVHTTP